MNSPQITLPLSGEISLVLDTNTVLGLWHFEDPLLKPLDALIQSGQATLHTRTDALDELRSVLSYRQFEISAEQQVTLLAAYSARCTHVRLEAEPSPPLPICRDSDDQKFLQISRDANAHFLLTRDKLLLKLNRHRLIRPLFVIMTPEHFSRLLSLESSRNQP